VAQLELQVPALVSRACQQELCNLQVLMYARISSLKCTAHCVIQVH
jgi:hypothetical protein